MKATSRTADRIASRALQFLAAANVLFLLSLLLTLAAATGKARAEEAVCGGTDLAAALAAQDPGLFAAIRARADETPNGKGLLWRIETDGAEPSFLFGTMHVSDPRVLDLAPPVEAAFGSARTLALEVAGLDDPETMAAALFANAQHTMLPGSQTLFDLLTAEDRKIVEAGLIARGIPPYSVRKMSPWMLYLALAYPPCELQRQQNGALALDAALTARARADGKAIAGLETIDEQLAILAGTPVEMQIQWLVDSLRLGNRIDDFFETMIVLYESGETSIFMPLLTGLMQREGADVSSYATFEKTLIDLRNENMVERAAAIIDEGNAFIAVGAAHLPGENGLVERLRGAGYTVTRAD